MAPPSAASNSPTTIAIPKRSLPTDGRGQPLGLVVACAMAANWIGLGHTQGRGKLDRYGQRALPVKAIFVYPLRPDFRALLTGYALAADAGKPMPSGKEHVG